MGRDYNGGQLFIKNFYLHLSMERYYTGKVFSDKYNIAYAYAYNIAIGYSIRNKKLNKRIFKFEK